MLQADRNVKMFIFLIIFLVIIGWGNQNSKIVTYEHTPQVIADQEDIVYTYSGITTLLGKEFKEIVREFGQPHESGFSNLYGPHEYLLYQYKDGAIRFCSPEDLDINVTVSIILTGEMEVLGARIGMSFSEIENILGQSDHGPDFGMDENYYMMYFFDGNETCMSGFTVTFSATSPDGPTFEAFIKWENYDQMAYIEV
jgi:hypothetical protein